jgi:hypothetical protein
LCRKGECGIERKKRRKVEGKDAEEEEEEEKWRSKGSHRCRRW